jgi:cephalosporin hydroxylase
VSDAREVALTRSERIKGWFTREEAGVLFDVTVDAVREHGAEVVEIGSHHGRSTVILGSAVRHSGIPSVVYAIDPHDGFVRKDGTKEPPSWGPFLANLRAAELYFAEDKNDLGGVVSPVRKKSTEVQWYLPLALLFIDGAHDYESVLLDYERFFVWVKIGAYICFHDYANPDFPDVGRFVNERIKEGEIAIHKAVPWPTGSLIVTKKVRSMW